MSTTPRTLALAALAAAATAGHAAQLDFSGTLASTTAVARIFFDVTSAVASVDLWTDSYADGSNFDPVIQLWRLSGPGTGLLLGENDDYTVAVAPTQTSFDAVLRFGALNVGSYLLSIVASPNGAVSNALADGFLLGSGPGSSFTTGAAYSAHITYLGTGVSVVPEPPVWLLMGLAALAAPALRGARRRGVDGTTPTPSRHTTAEETV